MKKKLLEYLSAFVTEQRNLQFDKVLRNRTRYITVALEDIYQPHNASAVLRTCECFGIQDVHIIENKNKFNVEEGVAMGSSKWLTLKRYNRNPMNSLEAIQSLKESGYRIVATTLHEREESLLDFDVSKGPFALFFGTEISGLTPEVINHADEFLKIPIYGFTESFNISVSAALILHHLSIKLRSSDIYWGLDDNEKCELYIEWLKKTIKKPEMIIRRFEELNSVSKKTPIISLL